MSDYTNSAAFIKASSLNYPVVITQRHNLQSFMLGQIYKEYLASAYGEDGLNKVIAAECIPESMALILARSAGTTVNLKRQDIIIIEPFDGLQYFVDFIKKFANVYFITRYLSHKLDYERRKEYLPKSFHFLFIDDNTLIQAGFEALGPISDDKHRQALLKASSIVEEGNYVSPAKSILKSKTGDHKVFAELIYNSSLLDTLLSTHIDHNYSMEIAVDEIFSKSFVYTKKGYNFLYTPTDEYTSFNYVKVIRDISNGRMPHEVKIDALVCFTYSSEVLHYHIGKINESCDLLKAFKKHNPQGNSSEAYVRKYGDYYLKPIVL